MTTSADYYAVLDVSPEAAPDEIKRSYRLLVRENHPDIAPDPESAHERMQSILQAYGVLSNPEQRARYDRELALKHGYAPKRNTAPSSNGRSESYENPGRDRSDASAGGGEHARPRSRAAGAHGAK